MNQLNHGKLLNFLKRVRDELNEHDNEYNHVTDPEVLTELKWLIATIGGLPSRLNDKELLAEAVLKRRPHLGGRIPFIKETIIRIGRWGTCASCPQDDNCKILPEKCSETHRMDHWIDFVNSDGTFCLDGKTVTRQELEKELLS